MDAVGAAPRTDSASARSLPAVEQLLANLLDPVFRYALRLTGDRTQAEDLAQETLLRAWRERNNLSESAAVRVWAFRIATNLWTDRLRSRSHQEKQLATVAPCRFASATKQLEHKEAVRQALEALDALPCRQRQVMHLAVIEQLGQAEIAEVLGISAGAVKSNLAAARKQLREELRPIYEAYCKAPVQRTR